MHDDRIDAGELQVDDVLGEGLGEFLVAHGVAAEFDDDRFLVVIDEVRQSLSKDARLRLGIDNDLARRRCLGLPAFCHRRVLLPPAATGPSVSMPKSA
mgnify:CR=1 FL=1